MSDLISRQAAIDVLWVFTQADALGHTPKQIVEALPSAQPERKKGRWIFDYYNNTYRRCRARCSVCGKHSGIGGIRSNQLKPFCPNCGAQMEGEEE